MENYSVIVRFGIGNVHSLSVTRGTTIGQALDRARGALGYPANVRALIGRVPQDLNMPVANDDIIDVETVGTSKAS